ncbi:MAG: hypothetical protein AAFY71_15825 [Bacteroidota bacterium]
MKIKATLLLIFSLLLSLSMTAAGGPGGKTSLFSFDEKEADAAVSHLTEIEQIVKEENLTLEELEANHTELLAEHTLLDSSMRGPMDELPGNIPPFVWGFCLGLIGVLIVYLVTDDNQQTQKSLLGCLVGSLVGGLIYGASALLTVQ